MDIQSSSALVSKSDDYTYYFTPILKDGSNNYGAEFEYITLEQYISIDDFDSFMSTMESTPKYYFLDLSSGINSYVVAVDRKSKHQVSMPTDYENARYSLKREEIYLFNDDQFRVFDVNKGKVVSTVSAVEPYHYDEELHAIFENKAITFLNEQGQKRGAIELNNVDYINASKVDSFAYISTENGTSIYDFETLEKIGELPYSNVNYYKAIASDAIIAGDPYGGSHGIFTWEVAKQQDPNANKMWTVHFNQFVDIESVNDDSIYVVNENDVKQSVTLDVEEDKVYIFAPENGYAPGNYVIHVTTKVQNVDGIHLSKPKLREFTVK